MYSTKSQKCIGPDMFSWIRRYGVEVCTLPSALLVFFFYIFIPFLPGVCLMVRMVGLGSSDPQFKSHTAVELIPGGVDCLSSFRSRKNECQLAGILCRSGDLSRIVPNSQGDCFGSTNALHRVWSQWMDGYPCLRTL